jgi:hypothetical protein
LATAFTKAAIDGQWVHCGRSVISNKAVEPMIAAVGWGSGYEMFSSDTFMLLTHLANISSEKQGKAESI